MDKAPAKKYEQLFIEWQNQIGIMFENIDDLKVLCMMTRGRGLLKTLSDENLESKLEDIFVELVNINVSLKKHW